MFLRLCARAGVLMVSGLVFEELRGLTKLFLEKNVRLAVTTAEHARRRTVLASDALTEWASDGDSSPGVYGNGLYQDAFLRLAARRRGATTTPESHIDWSAEVEQHVADDKTTMKALLQELKKAAEDASPQGDGDNEDDDEGEDEEEDDGEDGEEDGSGGDHGRGDVKADVKDLALSHKASLHLIQTEQGSYKGPVFPFLPFCRIVAEIGQDFKTDLTYEPRYFRALYDRTEAYLLGLLQDANLLAIRRNSVEVTPQDIQLARIIR